MMYVTLTLRNLKRSIQEYLIFMITVTMTMMLMYAFNSLIFNEFVQQLMIRTEAMLTAFVFVSILLVVVVAWLIGYVSGFIIKSRSKEFGLYLLSGMKRTMVSRMFVLEMFLMGLAAFVIGCILGIFFAEILRAIIVSIFDAAYQFQVSFSLETLGLTFVYFMLMWIVTLLRERHKLMKISIHELLYQEEKNEPSQHRTWIAMVCWVLAILMLIGGLMMTRQAMQEMVYGSGGSHLMTGVLALILSIYFFYYGFSTMLDHFVSSKGKLKYNRSILIIYGHIKGRIQNNRLVLATLSMLMIFTLMLSSFAMKFQDATMQQIDTGAPFDIQAMSPESFDMDAMHAYYKEKGYQVKEHRYCLYDSDQLHYDLKITEQQRLETTISYMKDSDYQRLLELKGYEYQPLQDEEYTVLSETSNYERLKDGDVTLNVTMGKKDLKQAYLDSRPLWNIYDDYIIVVADQLLDGAIPGNERYVAQTNKETVVGMEDDLSELVLDEGGMLILFVKADYIQRSLLSFVTLTFALFYLAFVFICISATIMATQQMMDASKQKYEYQLLHKLGMTRREIYGFLKKQIGLYFFVPMLLPIIYILPLLHIMDMVFANLPGNSSIYLACLISAALYIIIYFCYYLLAYIGCKRNLDMER